MLEFIEQIPALENNRVVLAPCPANWRGVVVANQAEADERIPVLLEEPAAVRFVRLELTGPVDLRRTPGPGTRNHVANAFDGNALYVGDIGGAEYAWTPRNMLDWVIVSGGETPLHPDWVRQVRDQCAAAGVPFFFAGWGQWVSVDVYQTERGDTDLVTFAKQRGWDYEAVAPRADGYGMPELVYRVGPQAAGRLLDGVEHNGFPRVVGSGYAFQTAVPVL